MGKRIANSLVLAAIPAFIGSLFLMHRGGATPIQMLQQALVFGVCAILCGTMSPKPVVLTQTSRNTLLAVAVVTLLAPLALVSGDGPRRWIGAGGIRLYVASVVLPGTLLLLARNLGPGTHGPARPLTALVAVAAALAAQPDASQATAFSLACLPFLGIGTLALPAHAGVGVALAAATWVAWLRPDPLEPVPYVEGVFALALAISPFVLVLALLSVVLPIALLLRAARYFPGRPEIIPVAIYYVTLAFLASHQLTPVPLLGFGAGPILGYFALVTLSAWQDRAAAAREPESPPRL